MLSVGPAPKSTWAASPGSKSSRQVVSGGSLAADVGQQPAHGRVAACPAVLALQRGVDGRARDALLDPGAEQLAVRLQRGDGGAGLAGLPSAAAMALVVGQGCAASSQPCSVASSPLAALRRPMRRAASDLAVGVALAHAQQGLSVVMHLESPARHLWPSGQKAQRVETASRSIRGAVNGLAPAGSYTPIRTGSITAITPWLHYAGQRLAPTCRSRSGSYMPVGDR
jgi:hypothetical protein